MSFPSDWFTSGWMRVLPRQQSFMLMMILGTAAAESMRGSIDEITRIIIGSDDLGPAWRNIGTSLDSPVLWVEKEDLEDEDEAEQARIKEAAEERRSACEAAYREAGVPVPTTIRELAATMVALGIASQDEDGTWWMPEDLPLPEKVLSLPDDMAAHFREYRRTQALEPAEQAIIHHLTDELGYPNEVFTSLGRLAEATEMTVDEVRPALGYLVEQGDVRLYRGDPRTEVIAKDLAEHARFYLVPDWEHFAEHRIEIRHGSQEGDAD
jgi:hypothetical protein